MYSNSLIYLRKGGRNVVSPVLIKLCSFLSFHDENMLSVTQIFENVRLDIRSANKSDCHFENEKNT